jgi:hypothetical protein
VPGGVWEGFCGEAVYDWAVGGDGSGVAVCVSVAAAGGDCLGWGGVGAGIGGCGGLLCEWGAGESRQAAGGR